MHEAEHHPSRRVEDDAHLRMTPEIAHYAETARVDLSLFVMAATPTAGTVAQRARLVETGFLDRQATGHHPLMRICIFGSGAVGSHFAVRLALAGHDVSCVMRGPHLAAVQANGLKLRVGDAEFSARIKASDDPAALGPQELVISTLKATALGSLVTGLPPLMDENTAVVLPRTAFPGGTISASPRIIRRRPISAFSIRADGCARRCRCDASSGA